MESETIIGETSTNNNNGQQQTTRALPLLRKKKLSVMVAVDESDVSLYALKWTLEHVLKKHVVDPVMGEEVGPEPDPEQGMVTLVHAIEPFERYTFPAEPSMYTSASMVESVRKAQHQNAVELLSRAFQICRQAKIKAETLILEGDTKEMLCQAAEQMHFDLLVVGSRGLGAIKSVNVTVGVKEDRMMISGLHTVADIFCVKCGSNVGWTYEIAHEKNQKYKEGKSVLERVKLSGRDEINDSVTLEAHIGGSAQDDA